MRAAADGLVADLKAAGVRVELDDRVETSFGRRATDWEIKGIPVRIEVGPRDLAQGIVTVVRRDDGSKSAVAVEAAVAGVPGLLDAIQDDLLASATQAREGATAEVATIDEAGEAAATGFAQVPWRTLVAEDGEARLRELGVTVRVLQRADGSLPECEDEPDTVAVVARSY